MKAVRNFGCYLWRFFIGGIFQLLGLAAAFVVVGLLVRPLGAWAGLLAFVLVVAVVWIDVLRRVARGQKW